MKFSELPYKRPALDPIDEKYASLPAQMEAAENLETLLSLLKEFEAFVSEVMTMYNLSYIRHTVDTRDAFYEQENAYYDACLPYFEQLRNEICRALTVSPFRRELERELGPAFFRNAELSMQAFAPEIIPDLAEENRLMSSYQQLMASARIPFQGQILTFPQLSPFKESPDAAVRKAAFTAEGTFLQEHGDELDRIFSQLIQLRTKMAKALGFQSFTDMAYCRRTRSCYGREDVAAFREQVIRHVVPLSSRLIEKQHKRNGISDAHVWDRTFLFPSGNPAPADPPEIIFRKGKQMYSELSGETKEFIDFMLKGDLFDVLSKDGKANGGYCTELPAFKAPFVFANFDGTSGDIEVLTHECGHAFESYRAMRSMKHIFQCEYTMDIAEIHSMGMEVLTYPWMPLFFGKDADKFYYSHLSEALRFLPYGCMVDHFQHIVYDHPELTSAQRHDAWLNLERLYRPDINYDGIPYYDKGGWWQRQLHIYMHPFYYIDYCLAQSAALMFWQAAQQDRSDAWTRYLSLVNKAGTLPFTELMRSAGFQSPMEDGVIKSLADSVFAYLEQMDDSHF